MRWWDGGWKAAGETSFWKPILQPDGLWSRTKNRFFASSKGWSHTSSILRFCCQMQRHRLCTPCSHLGPRDRGIGSFSFSRTTSSPNGPASAGTCWAACRRPWLRLRWSKRPAVRGWISVQSAVVVCFCFYVDVSLWEKWPSSCGARVCTEKTPSYYQHWVKSLQDWHKVERSPTDSSNLSSFQRQMTRREVQQKWLQLQQSLGSSGPWTEGPEGLGF